MFAVHISLIRHRLTVQQTDLDIIRILIVAGFLLCFHLSNNHKWDEATTP